MNKVFILAAGLVAALAVSLLPVTEQMNLHVYDHLLSKTRAGGDVDDVVIVAIDDASLRRFPEPLVLWHGYLAEVISGIAEGGARNIGLDIVPTISLEELAPSLDERLITSIRNARARGTDVIFGFGIGEDGAKPHRKFLLSGAGAGFLDLKYDRDDRVRRHVLYREGKEGKIIPSFPLLIAGVGQDSVRDKLPREIILDYRLKTPVSYSMQEIYDWAKEADSKRLEKAFQGKRVLLGVTAPMLKDDHEVPAIPAFSGKERIPGVVILAYAINTVQSGRFLRTLSDAITISVCSLIALCAGMIFLQLPPRKALVLAGIMLAVVLPAAYVFFTFRLVVPAASLGASIIVPGLLTGGYRYSVEYRQFRLLQRYFKSYVNPLVMEEILQSPGLVSLEGEKTTVTVLFSDIRNFTALSENADPQAIVKGLNRYFEEMTRSVTAYNGYLNKYIGDGILAVFGAPKRVEGDGALNAVRCGMDMLSRLDRLNDDGIFPGISQRIQIGIGIHNGEVVAGNVGCDEKMDYSVIGDTVNLASRIEGMTKEYQQQILVSGEVYERIRDNVKARFIAKAKAKGRETEVDIYAVEIIREAKP